MFKDKVYEGLDDISLLVEPFQSEFNEEIIQMPERIEVTTDNILSQYSHWGISISMPQIVRDTARNLGLKQVEEDSWDISTQFYTFKADDLEDGETAEYDLENNNLSHKMYAYKHKQCYTDEELTKIAKTKMKNIIRRRLDSSRLVNKPRMNEIADLFNADVVRSEGSYRSKVRKLITHLECMIDERKLEIKNFELYLKLAKWICLYISEGSLPALNNLTRIKIMTHQDRPIYSIEEKEV